ncbi:GNAT family N-acetyltransferase [Sporosarcina sp. YIM B06819]|uniref:GNAT family N-acetyltransferase n=1 Tax=Sporosarcina sp. YIM B06819 TaxID=3081769 RepID=UPI00298CF8CF|nr:GNAT family N-acetyltransferase [Sporosarcina sp. YIM B06819]
MEIRQLKPAEFEQAIQLADDTFREQGHTSMGEAFPHVFSPQLQQSFGAFDGDRLVSFMGLVPATIQIGEASLTVYSLGAVCTHEEYRKQGISTKILKEIYRYINHAAASLLFVSGDRGMYMRNQCYHFGKTYSYLINKSTVNKAGYVGEIRRGQPADLFQIDRIKRATQVRFDNSIWEWQVLLEASGFASIFKMKQSLYVASQDGVIEGYVVMGMPTENSTKEQAIVTEWGGDSKAIYGILLNLLENDVVSEIELTIPWHEKLREELSAYPYKEIQNAGTIHIVNAARLIDQLMPYVYDKNPIVAQNLTVETLEDDHVIFRYHKESKISLGVDELVALLFDPHGGSAFVALQTIFPIPLPHTEGLYFV